MPHPYVSCVSCYRRSLWVHKRNQPRRPELPGTPIALEFSSPFVALRSSKSNRPFLLQSPRRRCHVTPSPRRRRHRHGRRQGRRGHSRLTPIVSASACSAPSRTAPTTASCFPASSAAFRTPASSGSIRWTGTKSAASACTSVSRPKLSIATRKVVIGGRRQGRRAVRPPGDGHRLAAFCAAHGGHETAGCLRLPHPG